MRISSYAASVFAIALATAPFTFAQIDASKLTITGYQLVSEQSLTGTQSYFTYRADVVNTGPSLPALTATVTPLSSSRIQVVSGQGNLHFVSVLFNTQVSSANAFTILVDRTLPFSFNQLQWSFNGPVANAGPPQTVAAGATVMLDASGSTNPGGAGTLTYSWSLATVPSGSAASLNNPSSVKPSFVADVAGNYVATVTVSNGAGTDTASVTISTTNSAPVANAGPDQTIAQPGSTVYLDGSKSSDVDGNALTYSWTFIQIPSGSSALLTGAATVSPTFIADQPGVYKLELVVNDGAVASVPDFVVITVIGNTPPVANAGPAQTVSVGATVQLDGSKSTDVDGNSLTYKWSLISVPDGSKATLSNPALVNPVFTADVAGTYVAQLIVNDGTIDGLPATVAIATSAVLPPVANAGPAQTAQYLATVTLSGSGADPQNLSLTYKWSLIALPAGSNAVLTNPATANPTFVADQPGTFVAQLIVNNGTLDSAPSTVVITTTIPAPIARPGAAQTVSTGVTVNLDGTDSSDPSNLPLTYKWSLLSVPAGSAAAIASPTSATPSFLADLAGAYVAQLIVNNGFKDSAPATVAITAGQGNFLTVAPNPLNLVNSPGLLTITAGTPAGPGGLTVTVTVTDKTIATAPATVIIPQGQASITASITPGAVGSTSVFASAPGFHPDSATVNVNAATLQLSLSNSTVGITKTVTGTITLPAPPPGPGVTINLSADNPGIASFPATVSIPNVSQTGTFTITGSSEGTVRITASAAGYGSSSASLVVGKLGAINLQSGLTVGTGQSLPLGVTLVTPAPVGGVTITLTSTDTTKLTVSSTVFIKEGATSPDTPAQVTGVSFGSVVVSASAAGFTGDSKTVTVASTLIFNPAVLSVSAGTTQNVTLALSGGVPAGGVTVNLASDNTSAATVPATVTIPQNTSSVTVPVTGVAIGVANVTASSTAAGIVSGTAKINVINGIAISTASLPAGIAGVGYSADLTASGGVLPYTFSATGLPAGLAINAAGQITGTPQSTGISSVVITATDSSAPSKLSATVTLPLTVNPALSITTTGLPSGAVNTAYSVAVAATGGTPPYAFSATGLPAGLSLSAAGQISGALQSPGTSSVTITATDSTSPTKRTATATFSLVVNGPLSITSTSLPAGVVGSAYSASVAATGGATPYTFTATGLPAGLSISSAGQITGTPQSAGTSSVAITAVDSTGPVKLTATATLSLVVNGALAITTTSLPTGAVGVAYTGTVMATGGAAPYTFTAAGLPTGLSMAANGQITGTPQSAATSSVVVTVADSSPVKLTATATLSLVVNNALAISTTALPAGTVGSAYNQAVAAVGGKQPYTFSATGLPAGLAMSAGGQITGIPQAAGTSSVVVTVADSTSPSKVTATAALGLTIQALPLTVTTTILPTGLVGNSYVGSLQAAGGTAPYQWALVSGTLPPGLNFSNGTITGVPTVAALNSPLSFRVIDSGSPAQTATVSLSITVNQGGSGGAGLSITGGTVGNGLQIPIAIGLSPAPAGALNITISSNNPAAVALAEKPTDTGTGSLTLPITAGTGSFSIYAQGLASSGSVILTVSASGYASGTAQVTLAPSAFVLSAAGETGGSLITNQNTGTLLTISAAQLDAGGNVAEIQQVSGAIPQTVQLALADSTLGSLAPAGLTFQGGDTSQAVTFTSASSAGSTTISLSEPAGFTTPLGAGNTLALTVLPVGVIPGSVTVGQGLETLTNVILQGAAPSDIFVTIASSDPSKLLLAVNSTDAGSSSIQMKIVAGASRTPQFYVYGLASSGAVTYSASAPGFGTANGTVTLAKSGFVVGGPFGLTKNFTTTALSQPSTIDVQTAFLDASGNYLGTQALAGGSPVQVNVTSQTTSVGTIAVSPLSMLPANNDVTTLFQPMGNGSTVISVTGPAPFVTPAQGGSITATVGTPGMVITDGVTVGKNLAQEGVISLPVVPSTDLTIALTVTSGQIALSASGTDAGSSTINVVIPAGTLNATYYMYGLDSTGAATVSASAPGYATSTATLTLVPSGLIIYGPNGVGSGIIANAGGSAAVNVSTAKLDPAGMGIQPLAGGRTITASLTSSNPAIGTVPATVSIAGGTDTGTATFTAQTAGSTTLSVGAPSGYTTPAQFTMITAQVQ